MGRRRSHRIGTVGVALLLAATSLPSLALDEVTFATSIACPLEAVPPTGFTDGGATHGAAADCLAWYGIARGTDRTSFSPGVAVTRGQTASFVVRLLATVDDLELPDPAIGAFSDAQGVHGSAIGLLAALGVVSGYGDGRFGTADPVSRGQFATIVAGALDEAAARSDALAPLPTPHGEPRFVDVATSSHRTAIDRLDAVGIIDGFDDGTFQPERRITRGQVASILTRVLGGLVDAGVVELPPPGPDLGVELRLTTVATYEAPTAGAVGPGGTLYIAERRGTVRPLRTTGAGPVVLDISGDVSTGGEGGLLGMAFAANGSELYLSYTDRAGDSVIAAVAVAAGVIQPEQRRTVLRVAQPAANHNGGDVRVGPDGMLYIALGDGGGAGDPFGNGQNLGTLLGSVLRIDPSGGRPYAVPQDNPFVGRAGARPEIHVYGLRNPWRFAFDRVTGDLWIADVGQGAREEVNLLRAGEGAGANFGWNRMEGTLPYDGGTPPPQHVPPVYEYETRSALGCSVTGGTVYRGRAIPGLVGAYLFSDYCVSSVRGLIVGPNGAVVAHRDLGIRGSSVVAFVEDADGEVYVLELSGAVKRLDPA